MHTIHDPKVASLNLSPLFAAPIRQQTLRPPHHPGQSNYIWEVRTDDGVYIIRSSRLTSPPDEDFWQGGLRLFEAHPLELTRTVAINRWLALHSDWHIPQTLGLSRWANRDFLIVEKLPGEPLQRFSELSSDSLAELGRTVAILHQCRRAVFGPAHALWQTGAGHALDQFGSRLFATMQYLATRYYAHDKEAQQWVGHILHHAFVFPNISHTCPMMLDWDPSQLLAANHRLTGLVDTELYVVGPPQLELCALEYLLDRASGRAFMHGYETVAPFPDLRPYRLLFRVFLRLISFQGSVPWNQWINWPQAFAIEEGKSV